MSQITLKELVTNKRLASLELQVYNYVKESQKSIKEIERGFQGLASSNTIKKIIEVSPFIEKDNQQVTINSTSNLATITYDFIPDSPSAELFLSGISCVKGSGKTKTNIPLSIGTYDITIKVIVEGVGNWTLDIKKIEITTPGKEHERKLEGNPLSNNGTYPEQIHFTDLKL
ncbi:hypothetical protein BTO06_07160 [Tenacibaculum sp. SZ-18]|uniref:hypothetical protein n=1 Tax=Tenacibaculum sp. SZ-18 TaxID=754423 RepID=UPI000C2D0DDB|nr:hypothetical protein [Tenacibaculum sp. SZ-18]AUC14929.1 hypothetical protein BTO06_07160 [Tenacibaculum sp. SZ-18]